MMALHRFPAEPIIGVIAFWSEAKAPGQYCFDHALG